MLQAPLGSVHVYVHTSQVVQSRVLVHCLTEAVAGGEADEAQAQEDHEDVTTKEDAKPDGLVSAYWEAIGQQNHAGIIQISCYLSRQPGLLVHC